LALFKGLPADIFCLELVPDKKGIYGFPRLKGLFKIVKEKAELYTPLNKSIRKVKVF
jgi:hypothetical protein